MSMKSMAADGKIKKTDMFRVRYADLNVEPGHNPRNLEDADVIEHIEGIYQTIISGGRVPPLEIRTDSDDNIWIVDGGCRHVAFGRAIADGHPIEWIDVLTFRGNDADRVATALTSNQGLPLKPLEIALAYKRLIAFGWEPEKIAKHMGRTGEHVRQLLLLAGANSDVHRFVKDGDISAHAAIELLRKHGEKTGEVILEQLERAQAQGKEKVTMSSVQGRALPKKVVVDLVSRVQVFANRLPLAARMALEALESENANPNEDPPVWVSARELKSLMDMAAGIEQIKAKNAEKDRARELAAKQQPIV